MKTQLDKLNDIVYGQQTPQLDTSEITGQESINNSESWLQNNKNFSEKERFESWKTYNKDWTFTPNNREYYWQKTAELMPGSNEEANKTIVKDIQNKLNKFPTLEEKAAFYRDNAYSWSRNIHESMGDYFFALNDMQTQKDVSKLRMNQISEVDRMFNEYAFDLDPHVSLESHTEDALKAYNLGYGDKISAFDGRITAPVNGEDTKVFGMPDPKLDVHEDIISKSDLYTRIRKKLKPMLESSRENYRESEKIADIALLNRVEAGSIPSQFISNVIIDGVTYDSDPYSRTMSVIGRVVEGKQQRGEIVGRGGSAREFYSMYKDIQNKVTRRVQYDSNA